MKILITGASGQLGSEFRELAKETPQHQFLFTDVDELDITSPDALADYFSKENPELVVNCAAYTAVDKAEDEPEKAGLINRDAVRNLSYACYSSGSRFIHISTDYVFDGKNFRPYMENDPVNPVSVYGRTKMEGEGELLLAGIKGIVIRTSWLYSSFGNNFVKTMIKLGTPTYARDLAKAVIAIADKLMNDPADFKRGIYHFSNEGVASWYDFTLAVHEMYGGIDCRVFPVGSEEFTTKAPRPHYSVLNKTKIKSTFGLSIPHWRESLKECITKLKEYPDYAK
jgi:dTDP-4-dehydrorhamnose reductase